MHNNSKNASLTSNSFHYCWYYSIDNLVPISMETMSDVHSGFQHCSELCEFIFLHFGISHTKKKKNMELLGETLTSYCDFHKPAESHLQEAMAKMPFGFHQ